MKVDISEFEKWKNQIDAVSHLLGSLSISVQGFTAPKKIEDALEHLSDITDKIGDEMSAALEQHSKEQELREALGVRR
jgi:hypothetical protein